ncbi:MAG: TetR family transcriptional regulator [Mycobacteriaceae bacterium]|nr:TetR family transcriptional regulator [Mycobacteriaceae bacterium]
MTEEPAEPAARTAPGGLSEAEIVEAALRVVRTDGVAKLSMRRLSRDLGVSPMAPYYYVADKRELLDLVASAALGAIHYPAPDSGPWQTRLRSVIDQVDAQLRTHPGLGDVLIEQMLRPQLGLIAAVMDILVDAGFTDRNVLAAYATIHTFLFGRGHLDPARTTPPPDVPLPAVVERAAKHLPDLPGKHVYAFGVETLIAGLEAQLAQQPSEEEQTTR